jgi:glycosyltransferase involved in cell wall biosynthesis
MESDFMAVSSSNMAWNCSVIGWGLPSDGRTQSGYSRSLVKGLAQRGLLRQEFSLKQIRPIDALTGALGLTFGSRGPRLAVRRSWLWSERASRTLEKRLADVLDRSGDRGTFLQIGTYVEINRRFGPYGVLFDMTIPQAYRAGRFAVSRLSQRQYKQAVEVQRRVLLGSVHAFPMSEWARRSLMEDFGLDPTRSTAVYAGPSVSIPDDVSAPKRPHQILFVGIDWQRKGGPLLVEGFRRLRDRLPTAELVIVGCTPEVDCPGVRIEGYLSPNDPTAQRRLSCLYQESSCLALMSDFEPLGNVIVEAFARGLPVIAYDAGPQGEIVRDGENGVVLLDREPQTIAEGLYRILSDPAQCRLMGERAKQLVSAELNWDCIVTKVARHLSASARGVGTASPSDFRDFSPMRPSGAVSTEF